MIKIPSSCLLTKSMLIESSCLDPVGECLPLPLREKHGRFVWVVGVANGYDAVLFGNTNANDNHTPSPAGRSLSPPLLRVHGHEIAVFDSHRPLLQALLEFLWRAYVNFWQSTHGISSIYS